MAVHSCRVCATAWGTLEALVVDWAQLGYDISGNVAALALPGALWALLFLLAWDHGPFAESVGFGRKTFWLLLPGAILASFAILPILPISYDWLALSLGGAIFPMVVGCAALGRYAPPLRRSLAVLGASVAGEGGLLLLLVLPPIAPAPAALGRALSISAAAGTSVLVGIVAAGYTLACGSFLFRPSAGTADRRVGVLLAMISAGIVLTFAGSATIPGVGITESFPYYLIPPVGVGVVAALVAPRWFRGELGFALPVAYLAGTVGVLVGADLLREPPLYGRGAAGLYTVGGAGVLDLVYLSGLLALAGAYTVHRASHRGWAPLGGSPPGDAPGALGRLHEAQNAGIAGRVDGSLRASALAARTAAGRARIFLGVPAAPEDRPWQGLAVPGWVVSDQANLDAAARSGIADPREGVRAWLTARWLVLLGRELAMRRFASVGQRIGAFAIDLAVVAAPALATFAGIIALTRGDADAALMSLSLTAAVYGAIAAGFLYFSLFETVAGTTAGKSLLGLVVRDRELGRPGTLAAFVRNAPLIPVLTVLSFGGAIGLTYAMKGVASAQRAYAGIPLPTGLFAALGVVAFVGAGIALLGAFGIAAIALTWERQRVGDLWAGTWVVREATRPATRPPAGPRPPPERPSG